MRSMRKSYNCSAFIPALLYNQNPVEKFVWPLDATSFPTSSPADLIKLIINADDSLGIPSSHLQMFVIQAAIIVDEIWYSRNQLLHEGDRYPFTQQSHFTF